MWLPPVPESISDTGVVAQGIDALPSPPRLVKIFELSEMMRQEEKIIFTGNFPLTVNWLPAEFAR